MDNNEALIEQILAFLQGKMEGKSLRQFQQALESNRGLKAEVDAYRLMTDEFRRRMYQVFLKEVERFDRELPPVSPR
jgi:hypothetical protein